MGADVGAEPSCPSCGAREWTDVPGSDHSYHLFRCVTCRCYRIQLSAAPAADVYADYYSRGSAERLSRVFNVLWRWKRRIRARLILRHAPRGARVCDVGCERGELLNVLKGEGCHVVGTQISMAAAAFARRHFGIEVYVGELMDAPFTEDRFDVVLMLNVLEHLPDPERYVAQVGRMLEPGGTFWIEIPNAGSFTARLCGKNWLHHDPPHHLWAFDKPGIARLLGRSGFVVEQYYDYPWEFGPIGCVQSWLNWLPGRKNVVYDIVRRGFSRQPLSQVRELAHAALAGLLLPLAFAVATCEGLAGNGQVVVMRARKREL